MKKNTTKIDYSIYLQDIVNEPAVLSKAYSLFHNYSILNQTLAYSQLTGRDDVEVGPIASYKHWQTLGRQVKKGSKAISLIMPVLIDKKDEWGNKIADEKMRIFLMRNSWFAVSQTEGDDYQVEEQSPQWDKDKALETLEITEEKFQNVSGNIQGYASGDSIAINPVAEYPHKTRFHEIAHVVLGHTKEHTLMDSETTPRDIKEVEAESCSYILCQLLDLGGASESRGYIQNWLRGKNEIPSKSAQRIFGAVDKILKAGQ